MNRLDSVWCISILTLIIVELSATFDLAYSLPNESTVTAVTRSAWLDVGRVKLPLNNCGGFTPFYRTDYQGGYWPDTSDFQNNVILFDWGPWVVGKVNGVPMMGFSQWGSCYSPGPVINGQAAMNVSPGDSLRYRIYRIKHGDNAQTNPDYHDWPSDLGAPLDESGNPKVSGDQTVWTVFNNLDTNARVQHWSGTTLLARLPVEIQQTAYAHGVVRGDTMALLANVAFIEWTIINTGDAPIESTYVSLWTDIDFSALFNNRPAIDTLNQLAYCWQSSDWPYSGPRAVGFVWLYGPAVPSNTDVAVFKGSPRPGYRNLPISSFYGIQDNGWIFSPAYNTAEAWNIARGLDRAGHAIIDSVTRQVTRYPFSGDPVTGTGWISQSSSGEAGFNIFSGPFTMAPHDTQWAMAALVPVGGSDRMQCVQLLRQRAVLLRTMSHESFVESGMTENPQPIPTSVELRQNYPNPFNPTTTIGYALPHRSHVTLTVFNTVGQQVATLVNGEVEAGYHEVTLNARGLASGVYFYRLQAGNHSETKKLCLIR